MASGTKEAMNMAMPLALLLAFSTLCVQITTANFPPPPPPSPGNQLSPNYYDTLCFNFSGTPGTAGFQKIVNQVVTQYVQADPTIAASLLRLAFHDSFVEGADGSVLINSTANNTAEKDGIPNLNSLRGFYVIDAIKAQLEKICSGIFSCADIVQQAALAAMKTNADYPQWPLRYGRRDGIISLASETIIYLPSPLSNYTTLVANFANKSLTPQDMVVLSGGHTIGRVHCTVLLSRLYNFTGKNDTDPALNSDYATSLKKQCPPKVDPSVLIEMDQTTPLIFDNAYYSNVLNGSVAFTSDSQLNNPNARNQVVMEASTPNKFVNMDFPVSMAKLSEVGPLKLWPNGQIRTNCAVVN